ncbi:carboxypeptidase-like regulatory domain-containing protein [Nostoc sp. CHAB 5834]|nr:carboxypeptidase-like regulatory domain-containing protein [Nostoc sp. CHAB 5834]
MARGIVIFSFPYTDMHMLYLTIHKLGKIAILVALVQLVSAITQAQPFIKGQIEDGSTGRAVALANVFLSNTTKGTISDENGKFMLKPVPIGQYDLIISCVGFETMKVSVNTRSRSIYRIVLKPVEQKLAEFTVKAKRSGKWFRNLEFFKRNFLGFSENAKHCTIVNPNVLYFIDSLHQFKAFANDLLVIENKGLGYRVKYALVKFSYNHQENKITYEGYPVFEYLNPSNETEEIKWQENRRKAYLGSSRHFMKSLYTCTLQKNGFFVQKVLEKIDTTGRVRSVILHGENVTFYPAPSDTIVRIIQPDTLRCHQLINPDEAIDAKKVFSFKHLLQVTYIAEPESPDYQRMNNPSIYGYRNTPQVSIMRMQLPSVTLEPDGHFFEPLGIVFELYWSWELMAETLPYDYELI